MQELSFQSISIDTIRMPLYDEKGITVDVLRLDKLHPVISGNKWFKLKFYLTDAGAKGDNDIVTLGGAYSNHIVATAAACRQFGFHAKGIIRGERPAVLSPTLVHSEQYGMELFFVSRESFRSKDIPGNLLQGYIIPEGGYGILGARGASTITDYFNEKNYSNIACAVGTGTTIAGLINATMPGKLTGISVMKNNMALEPAIKNLLEPPGKDFRVIHDYHFGGYARHTRELLSFMNDWYLQTKIPSDFVYTGKLFFAIHDMVKKEIFPNGSRILIIHSGGLQGNTSLGKGTLIF